MGAALFAVFYAVAVTGSGLDRAGADSVEIAGKNFAPFLARSNIALSLDSARLGADNVALAYARRAVSAVPMEASASAQLGSLLLAGSRLGLADRAFKAAALLGWRDQRTQAYWAAKSLQQQDYAAATLRIDALYRTDPDNLAANVLIGSLERTPAGRAALVNRLRISPSWISDYAAGAANLPTQDRTGRLDVLGRAALLGARPRCQAIFGAINDLTYNAREPVDARRLWAIACDRESAGAMIANGEFVLDARQFATPFDWKLRAENDAGAVIINNRLEIWNTSDRPTVVAEQMLTLPAGEASLKWAATGLAPLAVDQMVNLKCGSRDLRLRRSGGSSEADSPRQVMVTIPRGCPAQLLQVRLAGPVSEAYLLRISASLPEKAGSVS